MRVNGRSSSLGVKTAVLPLRADDRKPFASVSGTRCGTGGVAVLELHQTAKGLALTAPPNRLPRSGSCPI
jgi:hypothetical protein